MLNSGKEKVVGSWAGHLGLGVPGKGASMADATVVMEAAIS